MHRDPSIIVLASQYGLPLARQLGGFHLNVI
jgi:hypothetical protein